MKNLTVLILFISFHFSSFSQTCELVLGGSVTIEFSNFSITNITDNGSDCTLDYTLDYKVNNPNGCGANFQAVVTTDAGSQTTFTVNSDGAWHTETGKIFNTACSGTSTVMISGGWGYPCPHQGIPWPGVSCASTSYSNSPPPVLPVELIHFGAENNDGQVDLSWTTASEIDNELFIIEHSNNGENFREVGIVEGAGTTSSLENYYFPHEQPFGGINYYRLKQVDFDGDFEYSNIVSIEIKFTEDIQVYPNPTRGEVNFKVPSNLTTTFEIYNQSGTLIQPEKNINNTNYVSLDGLPVGWYILKFKTTKGITVHRVFKL